jgi:hypothetical protein
LRDGKARAGRVPVTRLGRRIILRRNGRNVYYSKGRIVGHRHTIERRFISHPYIIKGPPLNRLFIDWNRPYYSMGNCD